MICDNCKIDRKESDYINNQKYCFRCEYRKKLENIHKSKMRKRRCRMCGDEISHQENLKKRQRTIFCSEKCALQGHKELSDNHWTRVVRNKGM